MTTTLATAALVAGLVRLLLFGALHAIPSGYSPVRNPVSDYAVGRTRPVAAAMTWVTVLLWLALAGAVWFGLDDWSDRGFVTGGLVVLAAIFLVLPLVPTDLEGSPRTRRGVAHYVLAIAWFAVSYSLMGNLVRYADAHWSDGLASTLAPLRMVALVSLIALVCALVLPKLRPFFGLAERVFIVAVFVFYLVVAIGLLTV